MDTNHATAGSDSGGDNLQSWNYQQFSVYLATVVAQARDSWGIHVFSVEPFNEPIANWWKFPVGQEGCHFDRSTQDTVIPLLRAELDKRGLTNTVVSVSDENNMDEALVTWQTLRNKASVGKVNTHGYGPGLNPYRGPNRGPLFRAVSASKKDLWMSEYGENDASGLSLAVSIALDFNELRPSGWVYWQAFDGGAWGLIQADAEHNSVGQPNMKYFSYAQYTRHVRSGMLTMATNDNKSVVAHDVNGKKLVLITVNDSSNSVTVTYDLSQFSDVPTGVIPRWKTDTNGKGDKYKMYTDTTLQDKKFSVVFPPQSIQTFEISEISV